MPARGDLGIILLLAAALVAACGSGASASPSAEAVPVPTARPGATVRAVDADGPFRLILELAGRSFAAGEPIEGRAWLELVPGAGAFDLRGSGSGLIAVETIQLDGTWDLRAGWNLDCGSHRLAPGEPITAGLVKSGGFTEDDPNAAAYRAFFADPLFRLPAGRWEVAAVAWFDVGECGGPEVTLRAPIELVVTP